MDRFIYEPINLDDFSFRLVRLLSGNNGPIQCELIHTCFFDMETIIEYEALSYTWGGTEKPYEIEMSERRMPVTENLFFALGHLRDEYEDRILWIDAICIDQDNDKERGHQVQQMGMIYERAERVVISLSEATATTNLAMQCMRQFEEETMKHACNKWDISDPRWLDIWYSVQSQMDPEIVAQRNKGLQALVNQAWFERVWVIQEAANARKAKIMCGTGMISSRTFSVMLHISEIRLSANCQAILDILPGPTRDHSWFSETRDLSTLLLKFKDCKASDPRDAVYGLLGISSDAYSSDSLIADYEKSMEEVVYDTILFLLGFSVEDDIRSCLPQWTIHELLQNIDSLGSELFIRAVENGRTEIAYHLIYTDEIDLNEEDTNGETPLWWAYEHNLEAAIDLLLEMDKVDVDIEKAGQTLLQRAISDESEAVVRLLVQTERVDINVKDKHGRTPLWTALSRDLTGIVQILLECGRADLMTEDDTGDRLIPWVVQSCDDEIVRMLFQAGDIDINKLDGEGHTVLWWAVSAGSDATLQLLLDTEDIDVNLTGEEELTPLAWAVQNGFNSKIKILLDSGKANINVTDTHGQGLLHWAIENSPEAVVQLLLNAGTAEDLNFADDQELTPLLWAARNDRFRAVELLLNTQKVDIDEEDEDGQTPLLLAAMHGSETVVALLLEMGHDDVDSKDNLDRTALSWAAGNGHEGTVKMLLATGQVDVDSRDDDDRTPLCWATKNGHDDTVKVLLDAGQIDVNVMDSTGRTPLAWANQRSLGQYSKVVELLRDMGGVDSVVSELESLNLAE